MLKQLGENNMRPATYSKNGSDANNVKIRNKDNDPSEGGTRGFSTVLRVFYMKLFFKTLKNLFANQKFI